MDESPRRPAFCWQSKEALRRIREAFDQGNCVSSALSVYMALTELASNAGKDEFRAAQAQIGQMAGVSVRTVIDRLRVFKDLGFIDVIPGDLHTCCTYKLLGRSGNRNGMQPLHTPTQPLQEDTQWTFSTSVADLGKKGKEPKGLSGLPSGDSLAPLTVEPLRGNSGLNGSRHSMEWVAPPESEKDFMHLMAELAEDMENHGGKWRLRWRTKGGPDKCRRVLADYLQASAAREIPKPGGYMNDNWKRWFEK